MRAADVEGPAGLIPLVGALVNAVTAAAFAAFLQLSAGSFATVGYYFDPTHPTKAMADAAATVAGQAPLLWAGAVARGRGCPAGRLLPRPQIRQLEALGEPWPWPPSSSAPSACEWSSTTWA